MGKTKSKSKTKQPHHKETLQSIDYSKLNHGAHSNTFGKVQKWLLESQPADATNLTSATTTPSTVAALVSAQIPAVGPLGKSQSTPEHLAGKRIASTAAAVAATAAVQSIQMNNASGPTGNGTKAPSTGNMNDKVKLQVVYKPPFKFSLKFSKNSTVKTKVLGGSANAAAAARQKSNQKPAHRKSHRTTTAAAEATKMPPVSTRRTALLVQTVGDADDATNVDDFGMHSDDVNLVSQSNENTYETLTPKRQPPQQPPALPLYENVHLKDEAFVDASAVTNATLEGAASAINTATFRINKSASGSNLISRAPTSRGTRQQSKRLNTTNSNSQTDLHLDGSDTPFGSSQNLIRSSTTNLTKAGRSSASQQQQHLQHQQPQHYYHHHHQQQQQPHSQQGPLSRSSTTNLSKQRRSNNGHMAGSSSHRANSRDSNPNLYVSDNDFVGSGGHTTGSGSRRNSLARQQSPAIDAAALPRTSSHSNLRSAAAAASSQSSSAAASTAAAAAVISRRTDAAMHNNIPRANLTGRPATGAAASSASFNRHSRYPGAKRSTPDRPYTADCTDGPGGGAPFEWPPVGSMKATDEPLPSDLEVMVSDVENLVTDI